MVYKLAAVSALLAFTASPAGANPLRFRGAAIAGIERTDAAPGTGATDGFYYGGQLGYDWDLGGVTAGLEGDLGGSTGRQTVGNRRADQGMFAAFAARFAVPVTSRLRAFVRGGYAYHAVTYDSGRAFRGSGWTLGGGGEVDLTKRLFLRAEYRFSDYGRTVRGQHFLGGAGLRF